MRSPFSDPYSAPEKVRQLKGLLPEMADLFADMESTIAGLHPKGGHPKFGILNQIGAFITNCIKTVKQALVDVQSIYGRALMNAQDRAISELNRRTHPESSKRRAVRRRMESWFDEVLSRWGDKLEALNLKAKRLGYW